MRHLLTFTAAFALMTATAGATTPAGPYKLDARGKRHAAAAGQFVAKTYCVAPTRCRDPKTGKFQKCSPLQDSKGGTLQDSASNAITL